MPGPIAAAAPLAMAVSPGRTRAGRGGFVSGLTALLFIGAFGNPWVTDLLMDRLRNRWSQALIATNFFAHWNVAPADSGTRGLLIEAFWADFNGGTAVQRASLGDERWLHWVANYARIGLLVVAIAVLVSIVLSGHRGNLLARWISAWGGVFVASALVGALTSAAYYAVSDALSFSLAHDLLLGAGYGATWALLAGLPISFFGAALSKPK